MKSLDGGRIGAFRRDYVLGMTTDVFRAIPPDPDYHRDFARVVESLTSLPTLGPRGEWLAPSAIFGVLDAAFSSVEENPDNLNPDGAEMMITGLTLQL